MNIFFHIKDGTLQAKKRRTQRAAAACIIQAGARASHCSRTWHAVPRACDPLLIFKNARTPGRFSSATSPAPAQFITAGVRELLAESGALSQQFSFSRINFSPPAPRAPPPALQRKVSSVAPGIRGLRVTSDKYYCIKSRRIEREYF
ncbi:hypothetical protein EVAR_39282_1 [Eumeta japonica]|uniref:Uncharacterized protein n=1 Tax=Eumeta variegata TaxID=151549 RepID=A0A4C1VZH3_EUMVA|nr:hypothetical protein EVAR_39282_1 [Eumeta japonica]